MTNRNLNTRKNTELVEYGKVPPQAVEIEEAVLGALLLDGTSSFELIADIISTESFYKFEHTVIFDKIKKMHKEKQKVDLLLITQSLADENKLSEIGGAAFLTKLTRRVVSAAHIEHHARIIAQKYYQRESIRKASEIIKLSYENEDVEVLSDLWERSTGDLENIFTSADTGTHIKVVLKDTMKEIEEDAAKLKEKLIAGIPSGFNTLDRSTGGWRSPNLIILAARPSVGKTSFALKFLFEAAKAGFWVNFFSYEMTKEDLMRIGLAMESEVYRSNIRDGYLNNEEWDKLNEAIGRLESLPILLHDISGVTDTQIKYMVRKNRREGRCDFVIIDYLQLVVGSEKRQSREQEVSSISRRLKGITLSEKIPVMALSQLNRDAQGKRPTLDTLRESGAIEQDADIVMFLHTDDETSGEIELIVDKHRRGAKGETIIYRNSDMTKLHDSDKGTIDDKEFWYEKF